MDVSSSGVSVSGFIEEFPELEFVSEERTRLIEKFTSHYDYSLTVKEFFGHLGCESSEQMTSAINNNLFFEHALDFLIK
jgi:hypothetical protein